MQIDRNAAAVVDDGDRAVDVNRDVDLIAEAGQRLVDRVVDDLVDEVMQPGRPGRPDVHRRPLADRFEPFEDLDLVGAVVVGGQTRSRSGPVMPACRRVRRSSVWSVCCCSGCSTRVLTVLRQTRIGMIT